MRAGWQDRQADRQRLVVRTPARELRVRLVGGVIAMTAVVALVALGVPGHRDGLGAASPTSASRAAASSLTWRQRVRASRQALIDELAPLRRPQTASERALARTLRPDDVPYYYINETIDRSLVRYATTTPWGERVYLVPVAPWSPRRINCCGGSGYLPPVEAIVAYSRRSEFMAYGTASGILRGAADIDTGTYSHGVLTRSRSVSIVPDGVTKVSWVLPRQPGGSEYGWPTYSRVGHLSVSVHGNVATAESPRFGRIEAEIWYTANGRVFRRFGSVGAAHRVVPLVGPGPETAQSRAAEQDASTPDHVSVTPSTGGPNTRFALRFRALLNNAEYGLHITKPNCPGVHLSHSYNGEGNPRGNLRGDLINAPLVEPNSQPRCPGAYSVSVRVTAIGPIGPKQAHPVSSKPFGTATFTVH